MNYGWWVSSEKVMVIWVRLGTFNQSFGYILWKVRGTMNHVLLSSSEKAKWPEYFRYFTQSFGCILGKVRSTWNHGLVSYIWESYGELVRYVTFTQLFGYILLKVRSTMNHGLVSFIWESYGDMSKVSYFHPIFWLYSVNVRSIICFVLHLRKL